MKTVQLKNPTLGHDKQQEIYCEEIRNNSFYYHLHIHVVLQHARVC